MNLLLINNIGFCLMSLLLYIFAPTAYSYEFCFFIFLLSIGNSLIYLKRMVKYEGMGFSYFFIFSFLMVNLIYPVFYFNSNNKYFLSFNYSFNENMINLSTVVAFIALNFFILFNTCYSKINSYNLKKFNINRYMIYSLGFILVFLFSCFIYTGGYSFMFSRYLEGDLIYSGIDNYLFLLINILTIFVCILGFLTQDKTVRNFSLLLSILVSLLFVITGYRSLFISIALILFYFYNVNVKKIKFYQTLIPIVVGGGLMYFIMLSRSGSDFNYNQNNNFLDIFSDLIINNWGLYVLVDYTSTHGSVFWMNFIPQLLTIFPFSGYLLKSFEIPLQYSYGQFPTYLAFGNNPAFGLGTNMVGEAFLSANLFGVILVFSMLGLLLKKLSKNINKNIYINIIFIYLVSQSLFLPRADYGWPIRSIVWMLVIYILLSSVFNQLSKKR